MSAMVNMVEVYHAAAVWHRKRMCLQAVVRGITTVKIHGLSIFFIFPHFNSLFVHSEHTSNMAACYDICVIDDFTSCIQAAGYVRQRSSRIHNCWCHRLMRKHEMCLFSSWLEWFRNATRLTAVCVAIHHDAPHFGLRWISAATFKLYAQLKWNWNKTVTKQFWNSFETVLFQPKQNSPAVTAAVVVFFTLSQCICASVKQHCCCLFYLLIILHSPKSGSKYKYTTTQIEENQLKENKNLSKC